jgi:chaperonin GroES
MPIEKQDILRIVKTWKPIGDRVIVVAKTKEKVTKSGLLTADVKMGEDVEQIGEVLAIGPGKVYESGERGEMEVKVGDTIAFDLHAGTTLYVDSEGGIHRGIGDLRDEWLPIKVLRHDSILSIL